MILVQSTQMGLHFVETCLPALYCKLNPLLVTEKSEVNLIVAEFLVEERGLSLPSRPQNVPRTMPLAVGAAKKLDVHKMKHMGNHSNMQVSASHFHSSKEE